MIKLVPDLRVINVLAKFENDPWKIVDVRVLTGLVCPAARPPSRSMDGSVFIKMPVHFDNDMSKIKVVPQFKISFIDQNLFMAILNILGVWNLFSSLWPNDAIWWHRSGSPLAQVMACCLTAPSHYLNQCWLMISEVFWHSPDSNFTENT